MLLANDEVNPWDETHGAQDGSVRGHSQRRLPVRPGK